jgi:hypothetical protein
MGQIYPENLSGATDENIFQNILLTIGYDYGYNVINFRKIPSRLFNLEEDIQLDIITTQTHQLHFRYKGILGLNLSYQKLPLKYNHQDFGTLTTFPVSLYFIFDYPWDFTTIPEKPSERNRIISYTEKNHQRELLEFYQNPNL